MKNNNTIKNSPETDDVIDLRDVVPFCPVCHQPSYGEPEGIHPGCKMLEILQGKRKIGGDK